MNIFFFNEHQKQTPLPLLNSNILLLLETPFSFSRAASLLEQGHPPPKDRFKAYFTGGQHNSCLQVAGR